MTTAAGAAAQHDGDYTRFEVRDGIRRVSCTVLNNALDAASGVESPANAASRRNSFDRFRTLIDAAAKLKLRTLPADAAGPLVLTREDLRRVPQTTGMPSFGSRLRGTVRVAPATAAVGLGDPGR